MLCLLGLLALSGGTILEARLESTQGEVRLTYRLQLVEGPGVLAFSAFGASEIRDLSAFASGERLPVTEDRSGAPRLRGTIALPQATAGEHRLEIRYRVDGNRVPVVLLDLEPGETRRGVFTARVELSEGPNLSIDFPSNGVRAGPNVFTWELPVIPAFVSLAASPEGPNESAGGFVALRLAGLSFWGLFAVNLGIVLLYVAWMYRAK